MRFLLLLATSLLVLAPARATEVDLIRVWPAWRDAQSFERISEYFTGRENTGRRIVVRTHAENHSGYYFLTRAANHGPAVSGAKFVLQIVSPHVAAPKSYSFPVDVPAGTQVYELGLTGHDWPEKKDHPVAWKLELIDASGRVIVSKESFLWEKPAK
jgi:hypothetical protein